MTKRERLNRERKALNKVVKEMQDSIISRGFISSEGSAAKLTLLSILMMNAMLTSILNELEYMNDKELDGNN